MAKDKSKRNKPAAGKGFGGREEIASSGVPEAKFAAREAERAEAGDAMAFALDVLATLQSPQNRFLSHPRLKRLGELSAIERPGDSLMEGAGMGLFPSRDIPAGTVVCLYPVHGIGRERHFENGEAAFLAGDLHRSNHYALKFMNA